MHDLRPFVKVIPGAVWAVHKLRYTPNSFGSVPGSGDWLYQQEVVSWLYDQTLRRQLSLPYRLFAAYCALQKCLYQSRIVGGQRALKTAMWFTKLFGLKNQVSLDLGRYKVFLDLYDPRMLLVPNELMNDDSDNRILKNFLSAGDTFVDVGANHGSFSISAAQLVGSNGLVVAIEPQPRLASLIEKSLAANARSKYEVHPIACGELNGHTDFYIPNGSSGAAGIFPEFSGTAAHRKISVRVKRFDNAVEWEKFPGKVFVKLDVEGSELDFLRGASTMIRVRKPHIMLEINPASMKAACVTGDAIVQYLEALGYRSFVELQEPTVRRSLQQLEKSVQRNVIVISPTFEDVAWVS
jgi:FkbM family methyltransferase